MLPCAQCNLIKRRDMAWFQQVHVYNCSMRIKVQYLLKRTPPQFQIDHLLLLLVLMLVPVLVMLASHSSS